MKKTILLFLAAGVTFAFEGTVTAQTSTLGSRNSGTSYRPLRPEMEDFANYQAKLRQEGVRPSSRNTRSSLDSSRHQPSPWDSSWDNEEITYPYVFLSAAPTVSFVSGKISAGTSDYKVGMGNRESMTMFGGSIGIGAYLKENLRCLLDLGWSRWDKTYSDFGELGNILPFRGSIKEEYEAIPIMFTLEYVFRPSRDFQFRIGPTIGVTATTLKFSGNLGSEKFSISDTDWMFTFGVNAGVTWQFHENISLGLDYRFCGFTDASFEKHGYEIDYDSILSHQIIVSIGVRF